MRYDACVNIRAAYKRRTRRRYNTRCEQRGDGVWHRFRAGTSGFPKNYPDDGFMARRRDEPKADARACIGNRTSARRGGGRSRELRCCRPGREGEKPCLSAVFRRRVTDVRTSARV